ncbi:MAG: hypothetical protein ACTSV1_01785 [Alphaproteobacteria bacterium]
MAEQTQKKEDTDRSSASSGPVMIKDQYLIDAATPLHEFDTPSAKAYAVSDRRNQDKKAFALICTPALPTRINAIHKLRNDQIDGILPLLEWDTLFWPPMNQETLIVIYELPLGGSVSAAIAAGDFKVNDYEIQNKLIPPLYRGLKLISAKDISHREVRADNLFFMDAARTEVVLGDCVTCPAGFDQPAVYETIENAMAMPGGRPTGGFTEDLYALGVSMILLLVGEKNIEGMNDAQVIASKIENSTFATLCGRARISPALLEPLRGLISDDVIDRWTGEHMDLWLAGKRQTPMQRKPALKAASAFVFMETEYFNPRILAHAFAHNIDDAAKVIKGEDLEPWIRRSLQKGDLADQVRAIINVANEHSTTFRGSDAYVTARVCILLDPLAPIRYRDFSCMPQAFGTALAVELLNKDSMQIPADVIRQGIGTAWFHVETEEPRDMEATSFDVEFSRMKSYLQNKAPGNGMERCLYEFCPTIPCLSPLIAEEFVVHVDDLLPALDNVADKVDKKLKPLDRHIAAFITARFRENIDPHLAALAEPKESSFLIGMLSLFAYMQWKLQGEDVYGLCSWVGSLLPPAINTYYSRSKRREIEAELPRVIRTGRLPELFELIDNAENRREDAEHYAIARYEFSKAEDEIQEIETGDMSNPETAAAAGAKVAAMTSIVISMCFITIMILAEVW